MTRLLLISCSVIVLAFSLGACSSSFNGFGTQAELAADADDYCRSGGAALGIAALNGAQAAYNQCVQQRFTTGAAGFRSEDSYAPGQASSLAAVSRE